MQQADAGTTPRGSGTSGILSAEPGEHDQGEQGQQGAVWDCAPQAEPSQHGWSFEQAQPWSSSLCGDPLQQPGWPCCQTWWRAGCGSEGGCEEGPEVKHQGCTALLYGLKRTHGSSGTVPGRAAAVEHCAASSIAHYFGRKKGRGCIKHTSILKQIRFRCPCLCACSEDCGFMWHGSAFLTLHRLGRHIDASRAACPCS